MAKAKFEFNSTKQRWYARTSEGLWTTDIHPEEVKQWKQINGDKGTIFVPMRDVIELKVAKTNVSMTASEEELVSMFD